MKTRLIVSYAELVMDGVWNDEICHANTEGSRGVLTDATLELNELKFFSIYQSDHTPKPHDFLNAVDADH